MRTYDVIMTPSDDGSWVLKSEANRDIAHQKYRRCLAKVEMCEEKCCTYDLLAQKSGMSFDKELNKWCKRACKWLELAAKFRR